MKRQLFAFGVVVFTLSACGIRATLTLEPTLYSTSIITSTSIFPSSTSNPDTILTVTATPVPTKSSEYIATLPIESVNQTDQKEIARLLFTQWLDHYKVEGELDDYELLEVGLSSIVREELAFVATVEYSVKPGANAQRGWDTGNGIISPDDPWIRRKSLFIGIRKGNNTYSLEIIGTGP